MTEIIFTTSKYPTSWLIRKITKEPASHCAIVKNDIVLHSTLTGVRIIPLRVFKQNNKIINTLKIAKTDVKFSKLIDKHWETKYDFKALFYLGLRYMFPWLMPKQNLWETSGMLLCTEFITSILNNKPDSEITPYQLYLKLKQKEYENG